MKYSAQDIASMRSACQLLAAHSMGYNYKPHEMRLVAESMLVTYMANGTSADELRDHLRATVH